MFGGFYFGGQMLGGTGAIAPTTIHMVMAGIRLTARVAATLTIEPTVNSSTCNIAPVVNGTPRLEDGE